RGMIISHGRRYIFVHIPKTGGTSLALALEARAMADDVLIGDTPKAIKRRRRLRGVESSGRLWKHSRLADIEGLVTREQMAAMVEKIVSDAMGRDQQLMAQLQALTAVRETENFTLAARRLGLAQPTVHRAVTQLEQEAGRILFERTAFGMIASSRAKTLAQCTRLAMAELDQAEAELSALSGEEVGRLTIGSLPLSRSVLLPEVITAFREHRATYPVEVRDGPYDELLSGLRRGEIDLILGALRDPAPIGDVTQEPLFADNLAILAGNHHPLIGAPAVRKEDLHRCGWVVPRRGTPAREQFENFFADLGPPASLVEAGSILLMRELLDRSELLGCISSTQARAETTRGLLTELPVAARWAARPIGLTTRSTWEPTPAQAEFLAILKSAAARLAA
ncbi:MAG: LysR family transcriptional regulator, partial [Rhodobacteraceae bacterium]|nr:LysR family transcriptional regulator [Paracoccaceae bacterium]